MSDLKPEFSYVRLRHFNLDDGSPSLKPRFNGWVDAERMPIAEVRRLAETKVPLGVRTGPPSGCFVVDVDVHSEEKNGYNTLAELERVNGTMPETYTVRSGGGGLHFYFKWPDFEVKSGTDVLGPGIDVKGHRSYVVAAGSHKRGRPNYEVQIHAPIARAPEWLLDLLRGRSEKAAQRQSAALEEVEKVEVPEDCCEALVAEVVARSKRLLTRLGKLKPRETLKVGDANWGWDKGCWTVACRLVEAARWPYASFSLEDAYKVFIEFCPSDGDFDPEHKWNQGMANAGSFIKGENHRTYDHVATLPLVIPADGVDEKPYPVSLAVSPAEFASVVLDREFRNEPGVLTLRHFDGGFWLWERGRFVFVDPDDAEALLTAKMSGAIETAPDGGLRPVPWKQTHKRELLAALKDRARDSRYGLGGQLLPSEGGIPFLNGFLDVSDGRLTPIGPERKIQWVIDAEYDPDAECPRWEQFLKSCGFGPNTDEYRLIRMWFGYLVSGSKKYEKGMLLIGKSRAGKGVMIRVAQALFGGVGLWGGAMAVEAETLVESHGYEGMPGKGLITLPETRFTGQDRKVNARLLSLTSNDAVRINPKMKKPFSTVLPGRLMIGTNETPHFVEATDALAKRLLVVRFNVSHADNPNTNLYTELVSELPGVARWALDGLVDLENEGKFIETEAGREVTEMIVAGGSYLREFLTDCFDRGTENDRVSNTDLHRIYKEWAKDTQAVPMSSSMLSSRFTDTFPDIARYKSGDKRGRVGLQIKPKYAHLLQLIYGNEDE